MLKGGRGLVAHEVVRIIQPTFSMLITRIEPVWANHREQHAALGDLLVQDFREIRAKGNGIDVHEHEVAPKFAVQPVHNTAGISRTVSSAIADKDFSRHRATSGSPWKMYISPLDYPKTSEILS